MQAQKIKRKSPSEKTMKQPIKKVDILHEIYHRAGTQRFITLYALEIETGLSGGELRPILEDLKEELLIVEHPEGFQVSDKGSHYCKSRWD